MFSRGTLFNIAKFCHSFFPFPFIPSLPHRPPLVLRMQLVLLLSDVLEFHAAVQGHFVRAFPFRLVAVPKQPLLLLALVKAVVFHGVDVRLFNRGFESYSLPAASRIHLIERPSIFHIKRQIEFVGFHLVPERRCPGKREVLVALRGKEVQQKHEQQGQHLEQPA